MTHQSHPNPADGLHHNGIQKLSADALKKMSLEELQAYLVQLESERAALEALIREQKALLNRLLEQQNH